MASGKKNYFRHSFHARNDDKIASLINKHGKEAYFHFFALIEICAELASDKFPEDCWFHFHPRTLADALLVKKWTLTSHLLAIHQSGLCGVSVEPQSAISDRSVELQRVSVHLPNLSKFMGRYETNAPNKRKEKEIKENKIKETVAVAGTNPEMHDGPKKLLPVVKNEDKRKITPLFAAEAPSLDEEISLSDLERNAITALNSICARSFRPVPGNMKFIKARIREGYKLEDFVKVIKFKLSQWGNDPKMSGFLRPETIFGTKFDSYLQEAIDSEKEKEDPLDVFFSPYVEELKKKEQLREQA